MVELRFSVSADLEDWLDARVVRDGYESVEAYLQALVARDRDEVVRVRRLIEEGIASGIVDAEPEDVLREIIAGIPAMHG